MSWGFKGQTEKRHEVKQVRSVVEFVIWRTWYVKDPLAWPGYSQWLQL